MKTFGERLRERREELGLTQVEVAEKIGVTAATYCRYETGVLNNIFLDKVIRIAEALKIHPAKLLGWDIDLSPHYKAIVNQELSEEKRKELLQYAEYLANKK